MKISQISKQTKTTIDTIRYYEKMGLITPVKQGYNKQYSNDDVERLKYISLLKTAGFSLTEIHYFIEMDQKYETMEAILQMEPDDLLNINTLIARKLEAIGIKQKELAIAETMLSKMKNKLEQIK